MRKGVQMALGRVHNRPVTAKKECAGNLGLGNLFDSKVEGELGKG